MHYLGKILGSETKIKLLFVLIDNPSSSYTERELAKESKSSISEVNRQIVDLVNAGIIIMQRIGKTKIYSFNRKHFLFLPLRRLAVNLNKIYRKIAQEIKDATAERFRFLKTIILIGSLSKGRIREDIIKAPSDIDLVIVVKNSKGIKEVKKFLLSYVNTEVSLKYGISLYPLLISEQEYLRRLKQRDPFILETHTKGEIIYGEKPKRFS